MPTGTPHALPTSRPARRRECNREMSAATPWQSSSVLRGTYWRPVRFRGRGRRQLYQARCVASRCSTRCPGLRRIHEPADCQRQCSRALAGKRHKKRSEAGGNKWATCTVDLRATINFLV
jgi:hypothetical protein